MKGSPLIIICGPTATGKTKVVLDVAKRLDGEIVSADSRQIYQGMNIGTGKDVLPNSKFVVCYFDKKSHLPFTIYHLPNYQIGFHEVDKIRLWLYDIIKPNQTFSAFEYAKLARIVVDDIQKRGKLPIVVGGTGFYIKTLIDGVDTQVEPDWKLRKSLSNKDSATLKEMLKKLNPKGLEKMNNSDRNNPRRLIRAIEIAQNSNKFKSQSLKSKLRFFGLTAPKQYLFQQINKRVEKRLKQGLIDEIRKLLKEGYQWSNPGMNSFGYKEWKPFFEGKVSQQEVVNRWKLDEQNFAKRQLTWFKKDKRIKWFDITKTKHEEIVKYITNRLLS